jgi:hypothetical protein
MCLLKLCTAWNVVLLIHNSSTKLNPELADLLGWQCFEQVAAANDHERSAFATVAGGPTSGGL